MYFWIFVFLTTFFLLLIYLFLIFYFNNLKRNNYENQIIKQVCLEIRLPKYSEYEISVAEQMYSGLHNLYKNFSFWDKLTNVQPVLSFEILGLKEKISFFVVCSRDYQNLVEKQILSSYPSAEIKEVNNYNIYSSNAQVKTAELRLKKEPYFPINKYDKLTNDPLNSYLSSMSKLGDDEALLLQFIIYPQDNKWQKQGRSVLQSIENSLKNPENKSSSSIPQEITQLISDKISKVGFDISVRIISVSPNKNMAEANLNSLIAAFKQFGISEANKFEKYNSNPLKDYFIGRSIVYDFINRIPTFDAKPSVVNVSELATLFHLPNKKIELPLINWLLSKKSPPDERIHYKGLWLGTSTYQDLGRDIAMGNIDDRRRHMYIIGQTGTGKSYFMQNLILQDIQAGHGVCFIDPHGDGVEWVLERIPPYRIKDVIYWNPGDFDRPFGFNILENRNEEEKHFIVNSFYKMIQKLFDPNNQGITGPILERAIRSVLLTAMAKKGGTLVEAMKCLLLDWNVINDLKQYTDDPFIRDYWEKEIPSTPENRRGELLGYFTSKLDRFISNRLMRNILGQTTSSFDIRSIMDNQQILLINLSKGLIGQENSEFLGLLLVPKILSSAMSRVDIPIEQRKDFFLYVDEFQNFATDDFAIILSEARKFRLNLIVANQYISQMKDDVKNAVFGNVGSIISFRVGADDAKYLENIFTPIFNSSDLINLENQHAYVKLIVNGSYPPPFSMRTTLKEIPKPDKNVRNLIINISRNIYGRDRNVVEADIVKRMNPKK